MPTASRAQHHPLNRLSAAVSGLAVDLRRLIAVGFVEVCAVNFYASILMPYYRSLGYDSEVAGVLTSVLQIVGALVAVAAGFMADNLGRKKVYVAGQLFRCLAAGLLMATRSYAGLVVVSVVRGLATVQSPAQSAIFASHTRPDNRATLIGVQQTASQAAAIVTPLLAGMAADRMGIMTSFGIGLALASLAVIMAIPLRDGTEEETCQESRQEPHDGTQNGRESVSRRVARMFRENRSSALWALLIASLSNGLGNGATNILLPFMVMDRFSSAYTTVSSIGAFAALGTVLVLLVGGRIADTKGRRGLVLVSGAVFPVLMFAMFAVTSMWQVLTLMVIIVMFGNVSTPAINAVYMEAVAPGDRATFAGLHMCLSSAGTALGSVAAGIGYKLNPNWSWIAAIVVFSLQLPMYAVAIPKAKGI